MNYIGDNENFDTTNIRPKPSSSNIHGSINILNTIVQHPYIEHLDHSIDGLSHLIDRSNIKILMYRISHLNRHHYVEYYIPDSKLLTIPGLRESNDMSIYHKTDETIIKHLKLHISPVPGTKRYKGYLLHNGDLYIVVQVRNNNTTDGWSLIWDILANKHIYGISFDSLTTDFFIRHHKLSHLYIDDKLCILPTVLYCQVPNNRTDYIRKYRSCQYVQREITPLIKLHSFSLGDNVRNLCFIKDTEISKTYLDIETNDYIIIDEYNIITYIFKHDTDILSFVKS